MYKVNILPLGEILGDIDDLRYFREKSQRASLHSPECAEKYRKQMEAIEELLEERDKNAN